MGTSPTESIPETTKVAKRKIELVRDHHRLVSINLADVNSPGRLTRGNHLLGDHGQDPSLTARATTTWQRTSSA